MLVPCQTYRHHFKACPLIPAAIRAQIESAKFVPGKKLKWQSKQNSKDYWSNSAREVGLVDNEQRGKGGIFFEKAEAVVEDGVEEEEEMKEE